MGGITVKHSGVAFVIYAVGFVLFLMGFASPYWVTLVTETGCDEYFGLWQTCRICKNVSVEARCDTNTLPDMSDWLRITALAIVVAMVFAIAAGATCMYPPVTSSCQIVAGIFAISGIVIFGFKVYDPEAPRARLDWSYGICVVGGALFFINGIWLAILAGKDGCSMRNRLPCTRRTFREPNHVGEQTDMSYLNCGRPPILPSEYLPPYSPKPSSYAMDNDGYQVESAPPPYSQEPELLESPPAYSVHSEVHSRALDEQGAYPWPEILSAQMLSVSSTRV